MYVHVWAMWPILPLFVITALSASAYSRDKMYTSIKTSWLTFVSKQIEYGTLKPNDDDDITEIY